MAIFVAPERPEPSSEASVANGAKTLQNTQPKKQNTHQQTNLLIQRKHRYAYDMTFLCQTIYIHLSYTNQIKSMQKRETKFCYIWIPSNNASIVVYFYFVAK